MEQDKDDRGRFTRKGDYDRSVRSIRLTDATWNLIGEKADELGISRADYLEALASGEISWDEVEESKSSLDFDVDEVGEILKEALKLKSNAGGKIKIKIKEVLEIMGVELDE